MQCEEGHEIKHECTLDCQESRCGKTADHNLCENHQKDAIKEARDDGVQKAREKVEEKMKDWEAVTDVDNSSSIEDIKNDLLKAIDEIE